MRHSIVKFLISCCWLILPMVGVAHTADPSSIVDKLVTAFMANQNVPGVAVVLYYNNKAYLYNYGVANYAIKQGVTSDTIFEIGSLTKTFTATLLAKQVLDGKMQLQDPIVNYLPAEVKNSKGAIHQVTLQQLATHTSGLPSVPPGLALVDRPNYTENDLMNFVANWQPTAPVGSQYLYSNIGFGLLGYALEKSTTESYADLVSTKIFVPLDMKSSSLNNPVDLSRYAQGYGEDGKPTMPWPKSAWPAGGAIRSTANDMFKYLEANLGVTASGASPKLLEAMQYSQKAVIQTEGFEQALAWQDMPSGIICKAGSTLGFSTFIALLPANHLGVVILTNRYPDTVGNLATQILLQLKALN